LTPEIDREEARRQCPQKPGPADDAAQGRRPLAGLRHYLIFFVIELKTRRAKIAGIHPQPYGNGWRRWLGI